MDNDSSLLLTVFLPLAIVSIVFGLPILAFVVFRLLAHRERMAMISAGIAPGAAPRAPGKAKLDPAFTTESAHVTLRKGIYVALIGAAITVGLTLATFHTSDEGITWRPGAWLLIGLVPMFIGIAQIIIATLSGATLAAPATPPPAAAPQPNPSGADPFAGGPPAAAPYRPEPVDVAYPVRPTNLPDFHPPATPEP